MHLLELALEQLPKTALDGEILARSDSAGASHDFASACRETRVRFSLGYAIHERARDAILPLREKAWTSAGTRAQRHSALGAANGVAGPVRPVSSQLRDAQCWAALMSSSGARKPAAAQKP